MSQFDSKEELYFDWYLQELIHAGIVTDYKYQPKPFILSDDVHITAVKQLKTKVKEQEQKVLSGHQYQADFLFYWSDDAPLAFFTNLLMPVPDSFKNFPFIANFSLKKNKFYSVIDVKGNFNQNDAWRRFSIDQKWVYQKYGILVQKIIPAPQSNGLPKSALFPNTFIPKRYQLTDGYKAKRKIHFKYRLLEEYLEMIK